VPNPGRIGLGAVLIAPDGAQHILCQQAPTRGCNNEAELRALMAALGQARSHGAKNLVICCDSRVVVEQLGAAPGAPIARLAALAEQARALLQSFEHARLQWIPRQCNAQADALARAALGMGPKRVVTPSKK
jgi:ribonuclease HI